MTRAILGGVLTILAFSSCSTGASGTLPSRVPASRLATLRKGVNVTGWLAQLGPEGFSAKSFDTAFTAADAKLLRSVGIQFVRLCVDPRLIEADRSSALERAVRLLLDSGLAVVVDMHPDTAFSHALATDAPARENFGRFLGTIAHRLASLDTERVFLELVNEPENPDSASWHASVEDWIRQIRREAPGQTILVGGYENPDELERAPTWKAGNILYDFHFYQPGMFTHQGADWAASYASFLQAVPWPVESKMVEALAARITDPKARKDFDAHYASEGTWDGPRLARRIAQVKAWARKAGVDVFCGEFGVYPPHAPAESRARWIADVRKALEAEEIGWAIWEYGGRFAWVTRSPGKPPQPDPAIVQALGLRPN